MTYRIEFTSSAERDFAKLTEDIRQRLLPKVDALAHDPRPIGVQKLQGRENRYRIRVGDYRIIYEIRDKILVILIVGIGHRREVYRN